LESNDFKSAQAGTLESMDCIVTITRAKGEMSIEVSGSSAPRFKTAMENRIKEALRAMGCEEGVRVSVQDNGAVDLVLGARAEAAYARYLGGML